MRVLVLGLSSLAVRRLLPAFDLTDAVSAVDIGTTKTPPPLQCKKLGRIFSGYDAALRDSTAEVVYISLINSAHEQWAEAALRAGKHVIVDKPALTALNASERISALAESAGLALAEALVYPFHPRVAAIKNMFHAENDSSRRITAFFSFPPLSPDNFRYRSELGGGALLDLGPYAASIGRVFFDSEPNDTVCRINSRSGGVEVSFSVLFRYPGGRSVAAQFGFDTQYENTITVTGEKISVAAERIFTTPPDYRGQLKVTRGFKTETLEAGEADSFQCFFNSFFKELGDASPRFRKELLQDARVLDTMMRDAGKMSGKNAGARDGN